MNGHLFGDPMTSTEITIPFSIASSWAYSSSQGRASLRPNHTVLHMYSVGTLCGTSISNYSASVDLEKSTGRRRPPSVDRLAFCFVRQFECAAASTGERRRGHHRLGLFHTHEEHLVARAEPRRWDARGAPHDKGAGQFGR